MLTMIDIHADGSRGTRAVWSSSFASKAIQVLQKIGIKLEHARVISETLLAMYSAEYKHYHTYAHVMDLFTRAEVLGFTLTAQEELAILFHDVIYVPGHKFNEQASVDFMMAILYSHDIHHDLVLPAAQIIRHTAEFLGVVADQKSHRVLDLDLSTLAADPEMFALQNKLLEREYPGVKPAQRAAFLKKFLEKKAIYYTLSRFEMVARSNIAGEIGRLEALAHQGT